MPLRPISSGPAGMPPGQFNIYNRILALKVSRFGTGNQSTTQFPVYACRFAVFLLIAASLTGCGDMRTPNDCLISGNQYFAENDLTHAAMDYREALKREPDTTAVAHKTALNNLGVVLSGLNKHEEAVPILKNAIELDPKNHISHYTLAQSLIALKQYKEAIEQARIAVELKPDELAAHRTLGEAALIGGDLELAITEFRHILKGDNDDDSAHQKLGEALFASGDKEAGLAELRKAIELMPDSVEGRKAYARVLKENGNPEGALEQVTEALKHNTKDPELLQLKEALTTQK